MPQPQAGQLVFDRPLVIAGDTMVARGAGCTPLAEVLLTADGEPVGRAVADAEGRFEAVVQFGSFRPGRWTVHASCGILLSAPVDMVLASSSGGNSSTFVLMLFFLLAGYVLVRFQFADTRRPQHSSGRRRG